MFSLWASGSNMNVVHLGDASVFLGAVQGGALGRRPAPSLRRASNSRSFRGPTLQDRGLIHSLTPSVQIMHIYIYISIYIYGTHLTMSSRIYSWRRRIDYIQDTVFWGQEVALPGERDRNLNMERHQYT